MSRVASRVMEVRWLIQAAKAEGYPSPAVDKWPDGRLRLLTQPPAARPPSDSGAEDLDAELEEWARTHGDG